jgi:hypothetical protein
MATHPVTYMALASLVCAAAVSLFVGAGAERAVLLGMLGPFAVAAGSWAIVQRTHERAPARVSGLMIKLFAAKMLLVGGYVAAVVLLFPAGRIPFVASFTAEYALLHLMEAWYLRRLFLGDAAAAGR